MLRFCILGVVAISSFNLAWAQRPIGNEENNENVVKKVKERPMLSSEKEVGQKECLVINQIDRLGFLKCNNRLGSFERELYDTSGRAFQIVNQVDGNYVIKFDDSLSREGQKFYVDNPARYSRYSQVRPTKKESWVDMYFSLFSYELLSLDTEGEENNPVIENDTSKFNTLPSKLLLEFDFKPAVLALTPDFDDTGGKIALYKKIGSFGFGPYINYTYKSDDQTVEVAGNIESSETKETDVTTGMSFRHKTKVDGFSYLLTLDVGYMRTNDNSIDNQNQSKEIIVDGVYGEFKTLIHYDVNQYLKLGVGARLLYGKGNYEIKTQSNDYIDNLDIFAFSITPLNVKVSF